MSAFVLQYDDDGGVFLVRCATCAHWQPFEKVWTGVEAPRPDNSNVADRHRLGLCKRASGIGEYGHRHREPGGRLADAPPNPEEVLAMAEDYSDCTRNFRTAATFGCVLWETLVDHG